MKCAATLPASDIERAKAWYSSVLHLEPTEMTESGDVWYEIGGTRLIDNMPLTFDRIAPDAAPAGTAPAASTT